MGALTRGGTPRDPASGLAVCRHYAREVGAAGESRGLFRDLAEETPVALRYNGMDHAVMMASPLDLEDFAVGFSITERIVRVVPDILSVHLCGEARGAVLDITLAPTALRRFLARERVRGLRGHSSCGLCGVADLDGIGSVEGAVDSVMPAPEAISRAVDGLRDHQTLGGVTRATHAAFWVTLDGEITLAREDVGRHSALDKLIGACARDVRDMSDGFCVISSRCSLEMVQKAVAAGIGCLVALSAPTALAVRTAEEAGLTLIAHARAASFQVYAETAARTLSLSSASSSASCS